LDRQQIAVALLVHFDAPANGSKKSFSAVELQRQLGHKRYQPIWEMLHKLRSIKNLRDGKYDLFGTVELDKGFFTTTVKGDKNEEKKTRG